MNNEQAYQNTDRELWREREDDYYSDSIHVTENGGIGMNCGGHVIVMPIRKWHLAAETLMCIDPNLPSWRYKLAMWLLNTNKKRNYKT